MKRTLVAFAATVGMLTACEGFKEAMTAHVDVVARAASQELSVDRLSELLGNSQIPLSPDVARVVADVWVNYQLAAVAAAQNDSLRSPKQVDAAMWPVIAQMKASKWHDTVSRSWAVDTSASEAKYNQGEFLAARHILWATQGLSQAKRDSMRKVAEQVQKQATPQNFVELAKKYTLEPGGRERGGDLGIFSKGDMVPEFQKALLALKPGQISPVVETQFGYHIIYRPTYAEVKDAFAQKVSEAGNQSADSVFMAKLVENGDVKFKDDAAATIKTVAKDPDAHAKDNTLIATSKAGDFTAARLAQWIQMMPQRMQVQQRLPALPDSDVIHFARGFVTNELVLHQADSAKITLTDQEMADVRQRFSSLVSEIWQALNVTPSMLADSAKTEKERERVASAHVDSYMDKLLAGQVRYVDVPAPLQTVLREKYDWKVNTAGLDRAIERATAIRAKSDSLKASQRPQSAVPMPMQPQRPPQQSAPPATGGKPPKPATRP